MISRLVSQSVRRRGLAPILFGILSHRQGNSLYLRNFPELAGHTPYALSATFPRAVVLGFVRHHAGGLHSVLDPCSPEVLRPDDLLVLLAPSYAHCEPTAEPPRSHAMPSAPSLPARVEGRRHRVLVLGWSYRFRTLATTTQGDSTHARSKPGHTRSLLP